MAVDKTTLRPPFIELIRRIRALARAGKRLKRLAPQYRTIMKWRATGADENDTGQQPNGFERVAIEIADWRSAASQLAQSLAADDVYLQIKNQLNQGDERENEQFLNSATEQMARMALEGKRFYSDQLLGFFVSAFESEATRAFCDIDVYGVKVQGTRQLMFKWGTSRFILRQPRIEDFEEEQSEIGPTPRLHLVAPDAMLRIETDTRSFGDLQIAAKRAEVLLRLYKVCSAEFPRMTIGAINPFVTHIEGSEFNREMYPANHTAELIARSVPHLAKFWRVFEPRIPEQFYVRGAQQATPLSIAYERYRDSLLGRGPEEKSIAFAIMGLEAIYLKEHEVQELMYRLELRVCKVFKSLGDELEQLRPRLKEGYKIRNLYVHGGHLGDKEKAKLERQGLSLAHLVRCLLDCLRISILHLLLSGQTKTTFLDMIESSLLDDDADRTLNNLLRSEKKLFTGV